jgi:hypothetical protein
MTRLAIAVAGVIAGFAALPQAAAAAPCELESSAGALVELGAPDRVAIGREGLATVTPVLGFPDLGASVDDATLSFEDAGGTPLASHDLTDEQLEAAAAANPWDRQPIEIPLPSQDVQGQSFVRLTYTYMRAEDAEPCELEQERTVRWFAGVRPRFTLYGGASALLDASTPCHELEPGTPLATVRHRTREVVFDLCSASERYAVLPGLRLWPSGGLTVGTQSLTLLSVGWRAGVRLYRVDVSWRGATIFTRWLRAEVRQFLYRRVYRHRAPGAFRDICQGEPAGAPLPILRDSRGRQYCRTPAEIAVLVRVLRAPPAGR